MDDIDRQIVALLRQDARRSFQSIGLRVSLSAPAVKRRVDRLEADGGVRGYPAPARPGAAAAAAPAGRGGGSRAAPRPGSPGAATAGGRTGSSRFSARGGWP